MAPHGRLSMTMGLRYKLPQYFRRQHEPEAYLVFSPSPILTLKGGVAGVQDPQLNQLATGIVGFGAAGYDPVHRQPWAEARNQHEHRGRCGSPRSKESA